MLLSQEKVGLEELPTVDDFGSYKLPGFFISKDSMEKVLIQFMALELISKSEIKDPHRNELFKNQYQLVRFLTITGHKKH